VDYKHPLCHEKFPLILFWSPKSGCTSLIKWYFFQLGLVQEEIQKNAQWYFWSKYLPNNYNRQHVIKQILEGKKDKYKLVRNPYKRAVSSFLFTLNAGFDPQRRFRLHKEFEKITNMFNNDKTDVNGMSFKQFLYYIKKVGPNIGEIDFHIAQQYVKGEEFFVNNYIHLDDFNSEIREIENKYGLIKSPLSEIIKSPHHMSQKMTEKKEFAETIITPELFRGQLPTYENFYDKEAQDLVRAIFQKDFEVYGYNETELT